MQYKGQYRRPEYKLKRLKNIGRRLRKRFSGRRGATEELIRNIREVKDRTDEGQPDFKLRKAVVDYKKEAAWKPRQSQHEEQAVQRRSDNRLDPRKIRCPHCPAWIHAASLQLRTPQGYRTVTCNTCNRTTRVANSWCQCGVIWHHCPKHDQDPEEDKPQRISMNKRKAKELPNEVEAKDINRKVPRACNIRARKERSREDQGNPFAAQQLMHIMQGWAEDERESKRQKPKISVDPVKFPKLAETTEENMTSGPSHD